jgi:PAS domain-containing protein
LNLADASKFLIALIAGLVTVFVIDPLDPSTISTPFCLGIILMGLSLRQSTSLVAAVSVLYSVLTVFALIQFHRYHEIHGHVGPHPYFWLFQRAGLFFVLCAMAIYMASYRTDTERILTRLRAILSKLPTPVILSDASGNIVYANDAVTPVLRQTPSQITGKSYFDFFHTKALKGKSIRSYFEMFEAKTNEICEIEIGPFGSANKMNAQIICLGTGRNRIMITVLQNSEKTLDQPISASHETSLPANFNPHPQ